MPGRWLVALLMAVTCGTADARARSNSCESRGEVAFWSEESAKILGIDLAYSHCPASYLELREGLSYYADDRYLYSGVSGSIRLQAGDWFSPYVGVGVLAGVAEKDRDVSDDGRDNDNDGTTDENGEEDTIYAANAFLFPEAGLTLRAGASAITLSARRYYGSEFSGEVIYSLGIGVPFDGF
jgi:hypothetical protein